MRVFLPGALAAAVLAAQPQHPGAGLFVIWYNSEKDASLFFRQPYLKGGQVVLQWADVEPAPGRYDFSSLDRELAAIRKLGWRATVQINGNRKPAWLFETVPSVPAKLSPQVRNSEGTLMYWHPNHRGAYVAMIEALGRRLRDSPDRAAILGLRMNFNAFGTEHLTVPKEYASVERWRIPPGVAAEPFSAAARFEYERAVVGAHLRAFEGTVRIFVRNNIPREIEEACRGRFDAGALSWFHTSSEAEPRSGGTERQYQRFHEDCRSGRTTCYAEPWASAWGDHGGVRDDRWCSPPQWFYWRALFDLHNGVSHIALYASDLRVAVDGTYRGEAFPAYRAEFRAAADFAANYAGYHALPESSPGAWIAFRENHVVRAANNIPEQRRKLALFTSDYTFLMERLPGDRSRGVDVVNIGPEEQRYGAWARILPPGETLRLRPDSRFVASLGGRPVEIRAVYFDEPPAEFSIRAGTTVRRIRPAGTRRWQTAAFSGITLAGEIEVRAGGAPVTLHMVEVLRGE